MDDEFKLCWKNFQDNIASGFQNLYDRGDLVDVTLACDGKLLHAHKIVLAICSPYFQEIFITNPCKHPIIILKDVTFNIMCELLEFMYQGVVNVKHTELQSFMKIGQLLQIKGLATNSSSSAASTTSEKSTSQQANNNAADEANNTTGSTTVVDNSDSSVKEGKSDANNSSERAATTGGAGDGKSDQSPATSPLPFPLPSPSLAFAAASLGQQSFKSSPDSTASLHHSYHGGAGSGLKRHSDFSTDALSIYSRKQLRRSAAAAAAAAAAASEHSGERSDHSASETTMDQVNVYDLLPQISMAESRFELNNVKRENDHHMPSGVAAVASTSTGATAMRNSFGSAFCLDYNLYKNSSGAGSAAGQQEYPNELHMPNDYSKNFGNHMDIPPISPGEHWFQGKLEFMLSQRGKPLLVHDGHTFGIQYVRKDKKYWQCNLSRKFNCKARVTTTDTGEIIVTNNEHCHTEIRQHLRKDYQRNKVLMNTLINLSTNRFRVQNERFNNIATLQSMQSMVCMPGPGPAPSASPDLSLNNDVPNDDVVLDLGKSAAKVEREHGASLSNELSPNVKFNDNDALDCGVLCLRTDRATEAPKEATLFGGDNSHNNNGDWKFKGEDQNA